MLNLKLREEFRGRRLKGTAIELSGPQSSGATQISAQQFLEITYPTADILKAIEAIAPDKGQTLAIIGERGLGKSHLMAAVFHAANDPGATKTWLESWSVKLSKPEIASIQLRSGMQVYAVSMHQQRYAHLWDVLFENHPQGQLTKGMWQASGTPVPSDLLIREMLQGGATVLLLDEFQTWFDGLDKKKQAWAFNFIQILSELAKSHPELLVLGVSVRDGTSDAYLQVRRVAPLDIDFKNHGNSEQFQMDRRRMLLHRLFENRDQIAESDIKNLISTHTDQALDLLEVTPADAEKKRREFAVCWPYSPYLLQLLEDQVLVATQAQETRDLIRILASVFKSQGEKSPVLTPADFHLDDEESSIGALLSSVANAQHRTLLEKAQRNILSVTEAVPGAAQITPHLQDIISALWLRSIAVGNTAGATTKELQVDITRTTIIDGNAFEDELGTIVENSFNIHVIGSRYLFKEEENPRARLMAEARNDRLFADESDLRLLAKETRYVISGSDDAVGAFRVVALPKNWQTDPWTFLDQNDRPENWNDDRIPILILPEDVENLHEVLGVWIHQHVPSKRNTVRFLIPKSGSTNAYLDKDNLVIPARAELKAKEWSQSNPIYREHYANDQRKLRETLAQRFDRFAILKVWNFTEPRLCSFNIESLSQRGSRIPEAIQESVTNNLFVPEDFEHLIVVAAGANKSLAHLLAELREPRAAGLECIPWLGEVHMKERILRLCARGKIAINIRGGEMLQALAGEAEDSAWTRLRSKLSQTGRQLEEVIIMLPSAVGQTGGATPPPTGGGTETAPGGQPGSQPGGGAFPGGDGGDTGGETGGAAAAGGGAPLRTHHSNPATSSLNQIGKLEAWGVTPATQITDISISISSATGAQLQDLLKKLPEGMTYGISLFKDQG